MVAVLHRDPEDARDKKTEDLRKAVRLDKLADVRGVGRLGLSEVVEFLLDLGQAIGLRGFCATGFELSDDLAEVGEFGFLRLDLLAARGGERLGVAASLPLGVELRPGLGQRLGARVDPVVKLSAEVGELGVERNGLLTPGAEDAWRRIVPVRWRCRRRGRRLLVRRPSGRTCRRCPSEPRSWRRSR